MEDAVQSAVTMVIFNFCYAIIFLSLGFVATKLFFIGFRRWFLTLVKNNEISSIVVESPGFNAFMFIGIILFVGIVIGLTCN